ncbi:hypothetical protein XENOCAPTIV_001820, partial [Xenoophorus captivus]
EDSVRTGLVCDTGETGGEEEKEEVEGDAASWDAPSAPLTLAELPLVLPVLLGDEGTVSDPGAPRRDGVFPRESSLDSLLSISLSLLLPSPHRSLSRVGEEAVEEGGWCFLVFLLASLKLARGGRSLTPLRVEPSMAFCNCKMRIKIKSEYLQRRIRRQKPLRVRRCHQRGGHLSR